MYGFILCSWQLFCELSYWHITLMNISLKVSVFAALRWSELKNKCKTRAETVCVEKIKSLSFCNISFISCKLQLTCFRYLKFCASRSRKFHFDYQKAKQTTLNFQNIKPTNKASLLIERASRFILENTWQA